MNSALKILKKRMQDPKLNVNFSKAVQPKAINPELLNNYDQAMKNIDAYCRNNMK